MSTTGTGRVWIIREGTEPKAGRYLDSVGGWQRTLDRYACRFVESIDRPDARAKAGRWAEKVGGRVVRLVSRAEAVERARAAGRAEGLREAARHLRSDWCGLEDAADELEEMASAKTAPVEHVRGGNCWGYAAQSDVCMKHEQPRGECAECPPCPKCKAAPVVAEGRGASESLRNAGDRERSG